MITIDSDPKLNPVNIGAFILIKMTEHDYYEIDIESLFEHVKNEFSASYDVFIYTLDWLFVAGAINLSENGKIMYDVN